MKNNICAVVEFKNGERHVIEGSESFVMNIVNQKYLHICYEIRVYLSNEIKKIAGKYNPKYKDGE